MDVKVVYSDQPSAQPGGRVLEHSGGADDIDKGFHGKYVSLVPVYTKDIREAAVSFEVITQGNGSVDEGLRMCQVSKFLPTLTSKFNVSDNSSNYFRAVDSSGDVATDNTPLPTLTHEKITWSVFVFLLCMSGTTGHLDTLLPTFNRPVNEISGLKIFE